MWTPGMTEPFEGRLKHADGTWRWFEVVGCNYRDDPDIGVFIFSARETTARKTADDTLRSLERRWRNLLQSSTEQVTVLAADGRVLFSAGQGEMLEHEYW